MDNKKKNNKNAQANKDDFFNADKLGENTDAEFAREFEKKEKKDNDNSDI